MIFDEIIINLVQEIRINNFNACKGISKFNYDGLVKSQHWQIRYQ